jgi:hypothetical protein
MSVWWRQTSIRGILTILSRSLGRERRLARDGDGARGLRGCRRDSGNGGKGSHISLVCSRRVVRTLSITPLSSPKHAAAAPDADARLDGNEHHVRCRGGPTLRVVASGRGHDRGLVDAGDDLPVGRCPDDGGADRRRPGVVIAGDGPRRAALALRRDCGRNQDQGLCLGEGALDGWTVG